jgi:hypothetical protein
MDESANSGKRLGLVAMALASLAAPVLISNASAASQVGSSANTATLPQTGTKNAIVFGRDGKSHLQTIILGSDGKPKNNRYILGQDGKYHDYGGTKRAPAGRTPPHPSS